MTTHPRVRHHPVELRFAIEGLRYALKTQPNFVVHCISTIIAVALGFYFGLTSSQWLALALSVSLVVTVEIINTALETIVDLVTLEYHPQAKIAKDLAAASVLLSSIGAAVVGLIIFLPKFLIFFQK